MSWDVKKMEYNKIKNANEIINKNSYIMKNPTSYKNIWKTVFNNNNPIALELGMGREIGRAHV